MPGLLITAILSMFFLASCTSGTEEPAANVDADAEIIVTGLDTPWDLDFLPDGRLIFTERPGIVSISEGSSKKIVLEPGSVEVSESGLLGIAVSPDFEDDQAVYLYYTHRQEGEALQNRISRFRLTGQGETEKLEEEFVLVEGIPGSAIHNGGRLAFGPDGMLYATTGDAADTSVAQDIASLGGKILRIAPDGSIPKDNPFASYVYSYGHRNPQGIAWKDGVMFASEHGPSQNDEINIIEKGANYGWPSQCTETGDFTNPVRCYTEFTLAPSGIAFLGDDLYVAGLRGTQLRKVSLGEDNSIVSKEMVISNIGRIRFAVEHDGSIYIGTNNRDGRGIPRPGDDRIIRLALE